MENNFLISDIKSRWILDSRGNPTVETEVFLQGGAMGRAAVPSGASTGAGEALELRDGSAEFGGKGVARAVANVNEVLRGDLMGFDASLQSDLDKKMLEMDGTENKANLGANAILSVSLAAARAVAAQKGMPLYKYVNDLAGGGEMSLPMPMMNVMNGGAHAAFATDFQEYMIIPRGAESIFEAVLMGSEIFHALGKVLKERGYGTTVGDEGGYAPKVSGNEEPLELISLAVGAAGYKMGEDVVLALDVAASEFYKNGQYVLKADGRTLDAVGLVAVYTELAEKYPIVSIEDGLAEDDFAGWKVMTEKMGANVQLVGDDLFVTNPKLLQKGIDEGMANAILVKPNQIGTLSETIVAVRLARGSGYRTVMSHRSGETEDVAIAHLAVGLGCGQIKTGSLSRTDRVAKYNELMRIAEGEPELRFARMFSQK